MKNSTINIHIKLVNDALYYIYRYIDTDINIDELCKNLSVSRFHMQRIFKAQMGLNIYEMIKSIRLQKAASLLITNSGATISEVASMCGYSSQTSFIRAFKQRFNITPKEWRRGGYRVYAQSILSYHSNSYSFKDFNNLEPSIVKQPSIKAYYIRHRGYLPQVKEIWQKLYAWIYTNKIENYKYIGIYHDNPIVTPLSECNYIAAVTVDNEIKDTTLPYFVIPEGLYAKFIVKGKYGDILKLIEWSYNYWLPDSGYEATTLPSYTIFEKNHFLSDSKEFDVEYYLPIKLR